MKIMFFLLMAAVTVVAQQPTASPSSNEPQPPPPQVYVLGNVRRPSALSFTPSVMLSAVIEQAGGAVPNEKSNIARIYRRTPGCKFVTQIKVSLKDIRSGRVQDISLQAGDIVEVRSRKRGRFDPPEGAIPCELPKATRVIY